MTGRPRRDPTLLATIACHMRAGWGQTQIADATGLQRGTVGAYIRVLRRADATLPQAKVYHRADAALDQPMTERERNGR